MNAEDIKALEAYLSEEDVNMALDGIPVGIISLEMTRKQLGYRINSMFSKALEAYLSEEVDFLEKKISAAKELLGLLRSYTKENNNPINMFEVARDSVNCEPNKKHFKVIVPEYRELSELLKKRVLEIRQQKITEDTLFKWDDQIRLMVKRDGRTLEQIRTIINECHDQPPHPRTGFTWRNNILSMDKLRLRWNEGKVYIGMNNSFRQSIPPGGSRII